MTQQVRNFAILTETLYVYKPFPKVYLSKVKALTRPINWLLQKLGAQEEVPMSNIKRVEVNVEKLKDRLFQIAMNQRKYGSRPICYVLGFDEYHTLVSEVEKLTSVMTLDCQSFAGCKVVLHPFISGCVALDFAP